MYIKLDENMDLVITVNDPIYRGDNLNRKIIYLIPPVIGEVDVLTAELYLSYIRADGVADVVILERMEEKYNENYYQYTLPITCKLTKYPGEVCTWVQMYAGATDNPTVSKSSECILRIKESKSMDAYLEDSQMTALYQIHKQMNDGFSNIEEVIDTVEALVAAKADNIVFDSESSTIQLTANGEPIGDAIIVASTSGLLIDDMRISVDGELLVFFNDGSIKNLGKVVGDDGMVYVPHIDEHNVLSFTLEESPTDVPPPVDLNPNDEWSSIGGDSIKSDYVWESIT